MKAKMMISVALATTLTMAMVGCGSSSSSTKKVYQDGSDLKTTGDSTSKKGDTSKKSSDEGNYLLYNLDMNSLGDQGLHLSTKDSKYLVTNISGNDSDKFLLLTDGGFIPVSDIENGTYYIDVTIKNESNSQDVQNVSLKIDVTNASSSDTSSSSDSDDSSSDNDTTTPTPTPNGDIVVGGLTWSPIVPESDSKNLADATSYCKSLGMSLPTEAQMEQNIATLVSNAKFNYQAVGTGETKGMVLWIDNGTFFIKDSNKADSYYSPIGEVRDANESAQFTCVK